MWSESWPHLVYGHTGGGRVHTVDIHPLGMGVNDQQEHLSYKRTDIIYVARDQGQPGHSQGCNGKQGGVFWWLWQVAQLLTFSSKFVSIFGHQTKLLAKLFILTIRGWVSWNMFKISSLPWGGTMTRAPRKRQPAFTLNSSLLIK